MRTNRAMRDLIQNSLGADTVDEVSKWNDQHRDSLATHGVELDAKEERLQQDTLELMATEELVCEGLNLNGE